MQQSQGPEAPRRNVNIRQREPRKIATTNITNELAAAMNGTSQLLSSGPVDEQVYPQGGGSSTLPVPEFTGMILTGLDGRAVWLLESYTPALPS